MDAVSGFYETADINSLISDFLAFPKFDRSLVVVKDGKGLPTPKGPIIQSFSALIYIKPGKSSTLSESIIFVTTFFNENTPFAAGGKTITLKQLAEAYESQ